MKISYDQLKTQNNDSQRCYLICGDEPLLVDDARQWLIAKKMNQSTEHIRFYSKESSWQALPSLCCNGSLLATQQIIDVRLDSSLLKADVAKIIVECVNNLAPQNSLIFSSARLEKNAIKSAWVNAIDSKGLIVQIWPLSNKQLTYWLRRKIQDYQLRLTPAASQMIIELCEGNLYAAEQALQKLTLLKTDSPLDTLEIQQVLTDSSQYSVFTWVDACLAGQQQRQLKIIGRLQGTSFEPTLVLWAIAREIRQLLKLKIQAGKTDNLSHVLKQQRITTSKQPHYNKLLQNTDLLFWGKLMVSIANIDLAIKGIVKGDSWQKLSNLGSALALCNSGIIDG